VAASEAAQAAQCLATDGVCCEVCRRAASLQIALRHFRLLRRQFALDVDRPIPRRNRLLLLLLLLLLLAKLPALMPPQIPALPPQLLALLLFLLLLLMLLLLLLLLMLLSWLLLLWSRNQRRWR
jgi:hypothetical protein